MTCWGVAWSRCLYQQHSANIATGKVTQHICPSVSHKQNRIRLGETSVFGLCCVKWWPRIHKVVNIVRQTLSTFAGVKSMTRSIIWENTMKHISRILSNDQYDCSNWHKITRTQICCMLDSMHIVWHTRQLYKVFRNRINLNPLQEYRNKTMLGQIDAVLTQLFLQDYTKFFLSRFCNGLHEAKAGFLSLSSPFSKNRY